MPNLPLLKKSLFQKWGFEKKILDQPDHREEVEAYRVSNNR